MTPTSRNRAQRNMRIFAIAALLLLIAMAAAWRFTPLHEYADASVIAHWLGALRHSAWAPLAILAAYLAASAVLFPNTVLNIAIVLSLGTQQGPPSAMLGSIAAAVVAYAIGRRYGKQRIKDLDDASLERIAQTLRRGGVLAVTTLRLMPIAPFTVVNLAAGALRVRLLPFVVGSFLGFLPGILLTTVFGHQLRQLIRDPQPIEFALLAAILVLCAGGAWYLRHLALRPARAT